MDIDTIKIKAKEYEFWCYGTTRIFEKRANKLKRLRTWITFLGLIIPIFIGGIVLSFGYEEKILPFLLTIAGVVGLIQLIFSTWSLVARWDESYEYAVESLRDNTYLFNQFKHIKDSLAPSIELQKAFEQLRNAYESRESKDLGQNITDNEKRFANRQSLKYFSQECHLCKEIPISSKPTKCNSCGNF